MNTKMTGLRLASVLLPALITIGLNGCSSSQPAIQSAPIVQPEPMEPEPAAEPDLAAIENQPGPDISSSVLTPNYPERHVVVKGDTLWDISKKFLNDPWLWPSVWHINPGIRNPHLIYPGDVIVMYIVDGKPYITLDGQAGVVPDNVPKSKPARKYLEPVKPGLKVVKLSPSSRVSGIHKAISTIPMGAIRPFLDRPRVVTEDQLDDAPYIVSSYEEHLISGTGNRIYARNMTKPLTGYNVVRPGEEYIDPESGDVLGYEAIYLADARLVKAGDDENELATLVVTNALREVLNNDVLIPHEQREQMFQFTPRSPEEDVKGQIVSVYNGVTQIGQYMIVVLNRGEKDGLAPGHVLAVMQKGAEVQDSQKIIFSSVDLPDERAGIMMVFKTYKNLSYALIMEENRAIHIYDRFEKP
ncbi:MAG: LysM peptidoglycan-binding domain-containing protein [Gammaproteobacteria bacterium]|nr:MAG: LysM peptidoglycan-binding domain-containing protein [Gammaproteobacteria bacterium]